MAHKVTVHMILSEAKEVQRLGRRMYKDDSLGINQSVLVVLRALASGEYKLTKVRKKSVQKEGPDVQEE